MQSTIINLPPRSPAPVNLNLWHQLERIAREERREVKLPRLSILQEVK